MKTALFYAIRRNLYNDIVAVTTHHTSGKWAGRYVKDNTVTHGSHRYGMHDLMGRFDTQEAAEAKREDLKRIAHMYAQRRKPHEDAISTLFSDERKALDDAVKVIPVV